MSEPSTDPGALKVLLDWAWAACLGLIAIVKYLMTRRIEMIEAWQETQRKETRDQLIKIYDKLEDLRKLIYERTDGHK